MKLILKLPRPRNPMATAGRRRRAGAHRDGDRRQRERRELRGELSRPHPSP